MGLIQDIFNLATGKYEALFTLLQNFNTNTDSNKMNLLKKVIKEVEKMMEIANSIHIQKNDKVDQSEEF